MLFTILIIFQIFIYYLFNFQADITPPNLESNAGLICETYFHVTTPINFVLGDLYNLSPFPRHNT